MSKNIYCMYWVPGSCGDVVQYLLSQNSNVYTGFNFGIADSGRVVRRIDPEFRKIFPPNQPHLVDSTESDHGWLERTWSAADCNALQELSKHNIIVIGTHRIDQLEFVKSFFKSSMATMSITYSLPLQKFVLKNYCSKVLSQDNIAKKYYKTSNPKLFDQFERNDAFGPWALKNELMFEMNLPKANNLAVDTPIDLGKLLTGDLQGINALVPEQSQHLFKEWLLKQNPLFTHKISNNQHYISCMGTNPHATDTLQHTVNLDLYDQILVNHYTKTNNLPACKAATHTELLEFFEKL